MHYNGLRVVKYRKYAENKNAFYIWFIPRSSTLKYYSVIFDKKPFNHLAIQAFIFSYLSRMLPMSDEYFMQQALKEAQQAFDADEVPIGAVMVINDKIIARAHNQVEMLNDPTAHAEILAITSACNYLGAKYLPDAALYVTIEPCLMCSGALYWSKVGKIVYGAADIKNGYRKYVSSSMLENAIGEVPFHPKTKIIKGVLQDECAALIKEFFNRKR